MRKKTMLEYGKFRGNIKLKIDIHNQDDRKKKNGLRGKMYENR